MEYLRKSLQEYFKFLDKHNVSINELIKKTTKVVDGLKTLFEQHKYVSKAKIENLPIGRVPGIKENLLFKIEAIIDEDITEFKAITNECKTKNMMLEKKLQNVKKCLESVGDLTTIQERNELCLGSASYPSILDMLEWADDTWKLYHALYLKFQSILITFQSEDYQGVLHLSTNSLHSEERKLFLEKVFAMTKKFVDDTIS